jgi:hypothetical protein
MTAGRLRSAVCHARDGSSWRLRSASRFNVASSVVAIAAAAELRLRVSRRIICDAAQHGWMNPPTAACRPPTAICRRRTAARRAAEVSCDRLLASPLIDRKTPQPTVVVLGGNRDDLSPASARRTDAAIDRLDLPHACDRRYDEEPIDAIRGRWTT